MRLKQIATAKLLAAAATFGLYTFDYRKAWAEEIPVVEPAPIVQPAVEMDE